MAAFVLDASVTLAWCFEDERSGWSEEILDRVRRGERFAVPAHWQSEVLNSLLFAARRKRIGADQPAQIWQTFAGMPMETGEPLSPSQVTAVLVLAEKHGLTAYDACYLELARRLRLPLCTLDEQLKKAAQAERVRTL